MDSILATLQPPVRSVLSPVLVGGDMAIRRTLPTTGLLAWIVGGVDSIGLSVSDKLNVRAEIWALLFDGSDVAYSDAQRTINIEASIYLNYGWELVGNETKGYAVYEEGTPMERAYLYFGEEYAPLLSLRYLNTSHYTNLEHYI